MSKDKALNLLLIMFSVLFISNHQSLAAKPTDFELVNVAVDTTLPAGPGIFLGSFDVSGFSWVSLLGGIDSESAEILTKFSSEPLSNYFTDVNTPKGKQIICDLITNAIACRNIVDGANTANTFPVQAPFINIYVRTGSSTDRTVNIDLFLRK